MQSFPGLVRAIVYILLGGLLAILVRAATRRLIAYGLDRLKARPRLRDKLEQSSVYQSMPRVVGHFAFWIVLVIFLSAAIETLGLNVVSGLTAALGVYLPKVLGATLILLLGMVLADACRHAVTNAAARAGLPYATGLGTTIRVGILTVTFMVVLDQLGIESRVLIIALGTTLAMALGALALAFGLGARDTVANIVAIHHIRRSYKVGDRVRLGPLEGAILEITQTTVVVDDATGKAVIPAQLFASDVSILLPPGS